MELGYRLRELREQRNLSGRAAATYLGISSAHVSDMENGKAGPSLELLTRLAKYYRTTTDYLLGLTDDPTPQERSHAGEALPPQSELAQLVTLAQRLSDELLYALLTVAEALASVEDGPSPAEIAREMRGREEKE